MTITQTVDIPASRRITLDVPLQIPAGRTIIAFTPISAKNADIDVKYNSRDVELINQNAEQLNREAEDALLYQDIDCFEDDIEQLTTQDIALMQGTVVQFNNADIVFNHRKNNSI